MIKCDDDNNLSSKIDSKLDQAAIIELRSTVHWCFERIYAKRERNHVNENARHAYNHTLSVEPEVNVSTNYSCRVFIVKHAANHDVMLIGFLSVDNCKSSKRANKH